MDTSMLGRINALRQMTVAELRREWERLNGAPTDARNRQHLFRQLAWEIQARAHRGLSDCARARLDELASDDALPLTKKIRDAATPTPDPQPAPVRDIRLPAAGSVISKVYRGHELRVTVRDDGFEFDGQMFASLTAIAKRVTGCKSINGKLFFNLTKRRR